MGLLKVKLRKDKDYVYCYLKEKIILEEDCDYYEHNIKCDEEGDFWGRTHRKGSLAGYSIVGESGTVLNDCKYCLKNEDKYEEYILPEAASKIHGKLNKKTLIDKLKGR